MPISAANKHRYPRNWPAISQSIRVNRAQGRCECTGQCGKHAGTCGAVHGQPHPVTSSTVVLTTAHLDHTPEHCDPSNLVALCQRCHLAYDAPEREAKRRVTVERKRAEVSQ